MFKHLATALGVGVAVAFVAIFFVGRTSSRELSEIAPRLGLREEDMLAMGPRIAAQSGATLGTSRRLVYLLACSGQATGDTLEAQALQASRFAREKGMTDREAATAIIARRTKVADGVDVLKGC